MMISRRALTLAATATAAAASAAAYRFLPDRVATRFDAAGQPTRTGSRTAAALTLPAAMLALTVLDDRFGDWPGGHDRDDAASGVRARQTSIALTEGALLAVHLSTLARALGAPLPMGRIGRAVPGVLMIALGNVLPTLPRNGLIGIRTPWTLADPTVWERTHHLGGYLLTAAGCVGLATVPATDKRLVRLPGIAIGVAVIIPAVYSFLAYRKRPHPVD